MRPWHAWTALAAFVLGAVAAPCAHHLEHAREADDLAWDLAWERHEAREHGADRGAASLRAAEHGHAHAHDHAPHDDGHLPGHDHGEAPGAPHGAGTLLHGDFAATAAFELVLLPAPLGPVARVLPEAPSPHDALPLPPRAARGPPMTTA